MATMLVKRAWCYLPVGAEISVAGQQHTKWPSKSQTDCSCRILMVHHTLLSWSNLPTHTHTHTHTDVVTLPPKLLKPIIVFICTESFLPLSSNSFRSDLADKQPLCSSSHLAFFTSFFFFFLFFWRGWWGGKSNQIGGKVKKKRLKIRTNQTMKKERRREHRRKMRRRGRAYPKASSTDN